ncbi:recombining binding protein suppressor of hairless-like protein isoform X3 [Marmota monax]|uniref:recombining binding protein suppressor of hairless-like protein isoform X3 n=1 Tax=Marmota monax TaxID=9995 RepID=UPI001EB01C9F|nr:recombining binding protein suppressor of hairless-like protein isoform X3 [Marmota monax]
MDPMGAAESSVPPGPLTHLSLLDSSEALPQIGADGRSLAGSWTRSSPECTTILREGVCRCLQQGCEQTVRILHAKVAQKSYGNEKRFFCPPPCVYLTGPGWRVKPVQGQAHQAGETGPTVCGYMGLDGASGSAAETQKLNFEEQPDSREFGCAKTLYISDADKRKHFRLVLRLVLRGGRELGTFHSRLIKVISKPSQKKQSLKNTDLCISSGSKVSLFNRLRSQTVSTRYLSVEDGAFVASARQWAAFTLHLADEHSTQGDFPPREGYVRYGSLVQLVCTVTGITLPPMIIRKVAKQCALLDVDEPISQLHKCAFQFPGGPPEGGGTYLCLATEKVVQFQASPCPKEANRALLNDSSCWTIIGTESVEFSFSTSLACPREPVTPVPLISTLELSGGGDVATLELHGENFHAGLKVWFGDVESETMYRCGEPEVPGVRGARRGGLRQRLALAAHSHHGAREPGARRRAALPQRLHLHLHPGVQRQARLCRRRGTCHGRRRAPGEHPPRVHAHQLPPLHPDVGEVGHGCRRRGLCPRLLQLSSLAPWPLGCERARKLAREPQS